MQEEPKKATSETITTFSLCQKRKRKREDGSQREVIADRAHVLIKKRKNKTRESKEAIRAHPKLNVFSAYATQKIKQGGKRKLIADRAHAPLKKKERYTSIRAHPKLKLRSAYTEKKKKKKKRGIR